MATVSDMVAAQAKLGVCRESLDSRGRLVCIGPYKLIRKQEHSESRAIAEDYIRIRRSSELK